MFDSSGRAYQRGNDPLAERIGRRSRQEYRRKAAVEGFWCGAFRAAQTSGFRGTLAFLVLVAGYLLALTTYFTIYVVYGQLRRIVRGRRGRKRTPSRGVRVHFREV